MPTNPSGKILITGGTGYLGRAILKTAREEEWDASFTILSRDEMKHKAVKERYPDATCVLGDVRDLQSLERAFVGQDLIIHGAAQKHIPTGEQNPGETVAINVVGSQNVCQAATRLGIPQVIGISTDKACNPLNVYGMTKALMERIFTDYNKSNKTIYSLVRYGNVVGSTGSVIPLFLRQHNEGMQLTLTDPAMTRFWFSYREAIETIKVGLEAPRFANIIPKCRSMSLISLAKTITNNESVNIVGARPGEKKHEELLTTLEAHNAEDLGAYYRLWMGELGEPDFFTQFDRSKAVPEGSFYRSDLADRLHGDEMLTMIKEAEAV